MDLLSYNNHEVRFVALAIFIAYLACMYHENVPLTSSLEQPIPKIVLFGVVIYLANIKFEYGFLVALIYIIAYHCTVPVKEYVDMTKQKLQ